MARAFPRALLLVAVAPYSRTPTSWARWPDMPSRWPLSRRR